MSTFDNIQELRSFRSCEDRVIPRKVMGKVLEAGRNAPSPGNVQSLEFVVVEDEHTKESLSRSANDERVEEAPTAVVLVADINRMARRVGQGLARETCTSEAACAAQNMRLVAAEEDIASCWIGGFDEDTVAETLDVPSGKQPIGMVILGYSEDQIEKDSKFGLGAICFYDSYGNKLGSNFDGIEWEGVREEKEIYGRKWKGLKTKLSDKVRKYL